MQLIAKSEFCRRRNCPKLFRDEKGVYYVQGYTVSNAKQKVPDMPKGETLIRIDPSLLRQIKKATAV